MMHRYLVCGLFLATGCGAAVDAEPDGDPVSGAAGAKDVSRTSEAITSSGLSHYCSKVWPATNGWAANWGDADPCKDTSGGTIVRAGVYSTYGLNHVTLACDPNYVWIYSDYGAKPIAAAYQAAASTQTQGGCTLTVAPANLPIFVSPFDPATPNVSHATGFDFARLPYKTLDVTQFGQSGSTTATEVDFKGRDRGTKFIDDHDAQDWLMPRGTPIRAVADGTVISAAFWPGCTKNCDTTGNPDSGDEGEIFIKHTLQEPIGMYDEYFATGYFHLQGIALAILNNPGATVHQGDVIGYSGNRAPNGGSSTPHLHFAVWRLTNTAKKFVVNDYQRQDLINVPGAVGPTVIVDPYGWSAPKGFDPWGYMATWDTSVFPGGAGAMSINLWIAPAPTIGNW